MKALTHEQQKALLMAVGKVLAEGDYSLIEDSLSVGYGSDDIYKKPMVEDLKINFSVVGNNGSFSEAILKHYNNATKGCN